MSEPCKSKLPRLTATPVRGTPQSDARGATESMGSRIPRLADTATPSIPWKKGNVATDKPLPHAPSFSTRTPIPRHYARGIVGSRTIGDASSRAAKTRIAGNDLQLSRSFAKRPPSHRPQSSNGQSTTLQRLSASLGDSDKFIVRRLRNTSPAGDGPTLRISNNAHSVILGNVAQAQSSNSSATTSVSDQDEIKLSRQRALNALEGRSEPHIEPAEGEDLSHLKNFVEKATQYRKDMKNRPALPQRIRPPLKLATKAIGNSQGLSSDSKQVIGAPIIAIRDEKASGLAVTMQSCQRLDEHGWIASRHGRRRSLLHGPPAERVSSTRSPSESTRMSEFDNTRSSEVGSIKEPATPDTPLLEAPSSASTVNLSHPGAPRLISRLPLASAITTSPKTGAIRLRRQPTDISTSNRAFSLAMTDRRFGFRMTPRSSSIRDKQAMQPSADESMSASMPANATRITSRSNRLPVRSLLSDFILRRKTRRNSRPKSPANPPSKPAVAHNVHISTTPVPRGMSMRKSKPALTMPNLPKAIRPTMQVKDPVDRHNAAMRQAQSLRTRLRGATSHMASGKTKLELLEAAELFNSTTKHSLAALAASEKARVSALEAQRFWELTLAAMYSNMSILETKINRIGLMTSGKRRGSF